MTKREQAAQLLDELKEMAAGDDVAMALVQAHEEEYNNLSFQKPVDWGSLERQFYNSLSNFRNRVMGHVRDVMDTFLEGALGEEGTFSISNNILTNILINAFGVDNVLSIVEDISSTFQGNLKKSFQKQEETLSMSDIIATYQDALDAFFEENRKSLFLSFKDKYDCKSEQEVNEAFGKIQESLSQSLISEEQIRRTITLAWVKSAKDSHKDADDYAGCFRVDIEYYGEFKYDGTPTGNIRWNILNCEVDDISHPGGTKAILETTYGGNTLLKDIYEIPTVVYIATVNHFEANRKGIEHVSASGYKKGNSNAWTHADGNKKLFEAFINSDSKYHPKVSDLK